MSFKLSVVQEVEKGVLTYKQAQKKYGIQGRSTGFIMLFYKSRKTIMIF